MRQDLSREDRKRPVRPRVCRLFVSDRQAKVGNSVMLQALAGDLARRSKRRRWARPKVSKGGSARKQGAATEVPAAAAGMHQQVANIDVK